MGIYERFGFVLERMVVLEVDGTGLTVICDQGGERERRIFVLCYGEGTSTTREQSQQGECMIR